MIPRSNRAEVRNPILAVPGERERLIKLPPVAREALRLMLIDIAADARGRADKCWRTHKAPMALYWKVVAVYAGHIARAINHAHAADQLDLAA